MKILVGEEIGHGVWVDGFDWKSIIAAGKSESLAVQNSAETQVETDRGLHAHGYYPTCDEFRCMEQGLLIIGQMRSTYAWPYEHSLDMFNLWAKTYRDTYASREQLDAFLRRVGQLT